MYKFAAKTEIRFGEGALDSLSEFKYEKAAIITDAFMVSSGVADKIAAKMSGCASVKVFGDVKPNPPIELVADGLKFLLDNEIQFVVALGGGSSIDAAKSMIIIAGQSGNKIPFVAIPTTSGTGSEVTKFAVVTDTQAGIKYPLVDEALLPSVAILDAELGSSAPPSITADTGFDAITHAIEAYVSTQANDFSDAFAEKSCELAFRYLLPAVRNGKDLIAREKMHSASCIAGLAFSEVSLGINHGIAHALGARFHIPHGRANAILLPYVIEFNADLPTGYAKDYSAAAQKYAMIARRIGLPCPNVRAGVLNLIRCIKDMMKEADVPLTLKDNKVTQEQYAALKDKVIENALADACTATNPRPLTPADVEAILSNIAKW